LIVDGRVGEVTPDSLAVPLFAALPVTDRLGIRAFVGVPIHRRNGDLYGTLCAFSQRPDDTLQARDAGILHLLGEIAMDLVEVEDRRDGARHDVIARLEQLNAAGGPHPVYQPVLTLDGLQVVGYEALSRFPGSDRNPAQWFADATSAGLGTELELRALANAVVALPQISGFLSVNVSPATLLTPGLGRQLASLPLDRIILELTEHEPIRDYDSVTAALLPLRAQGLRVAVDDAGAGFASMAHILALVPEMIKLDISLVRGIDRDLGRQALAAALTAFAIKTSAGVIAEGIETEAELASLRELGIAYGQGYHLGRPGPLPVV
jgi:EAL domain-containing protein (putative c-di-GMP-specific phosphodiesterase class I)